MTMLSPKTPIPNLFLTGQSLVLHGLEGVTMTAMNTIKEIENSK
jgi:all-trans-retinol 13,14-reductase